MSPNRHTGGGVTLTDNGASNGAASPATTSMFAMEKQRRGADVRAYCGDLAATSALISYGWGTIPVESRIGATGWTTSLFPKDGRYIVPVKAWVRKAEGIDVGDLVRVKLRANVV